MVLLPALTVGTTERSGGLKMAVLSVRPHIFALAKTVPFAGGAFGPRRVGCGRLDLVVSSRPDFLSTLLSVADCNMDIGSAASQDIFAATPPILVFHILWPNPCILRFRIDAAAWLGPLFSIVLFLSGQLVRIIDGLVLQFWGRHGSGHTWFNMTKLERSREKA